MSKYTKKRIFVYREIRKDFVIKHNNFNLHKYCIYDLIRRRVKSDTNSFEGNYKEISDWLGVSKSAITYHIKKMIESGILLKNDFGIELVNNFNYDEFLCKSKKGAFVILDFNIRKKLNENFKLTLEQFSILTLIFSFQTSTMRHLSIGDVNRLLILNRNTVKKCLSKIEALGLIEPYKETRRLKLTEHIRLEYFNTYELDLESNRNKFQSLNEDKPKKHKSFGNDELE